MFLPSLLFAFAASLEQREPLAAAENCVPPAGKTYSMVLSDIHDGDKKRFDITGSSDPKLASITLSPYNNSQSWTGHASWNGTGCFAMIDFNVPGKPPPPPVKLLMSYVFDAKLKQGPFFPMMSFTDPSGTIASKSTVLNLWLVTGTLSSSVEAAIAEDEVGVWGQPGSRKTAAR